MTHNQENITGYHQGDSLKITVTVEQNGSAKDISSATEITYLVKENETDDDANAILQKTLSGGGITFTTDGTDGQFDVSIDTGDTTGVTGDKHHRARVTDGAGNRSTVFTGTLSIEV